MLPALKTVSDQVHQTTPSAGARLIRPRQPVNQSFHRQERTFPWPFSTDINSRGFKIHTHVLEVAELQAGCEALRLQMNTAEPNAELVNSVTRLQSTLARAERALFKVVRMGKRRDMAYVSQ